MVRKTKIAFVDIDWTIYDHSNGGHVFDYESIEALNKLRKLGTKVVICTARPYHSVKQTGLFNYIEVDGMILSNGALVIADNEIVYQNEINPKKVIKIADLVMQNEVNLEIIEPFTSYIVKDIDQNVINLYGTYYEEDPPVKDYHNPHALALMLFAPESYDEMFISNMPKGISYFRFHPFGVDLVEKIQSKGAAIKKMLKHYKIAKKDSISFGDDLQDIAMFQTTGISYCMLNGKDDAKAAASEVIPHVSEHGVKQTLEKYYL